jgi:transglutaminase-like putative cysteine protease
MTAAPATTSTTSTAPPTSTAGSGTGRAQRATLLVAAEIALWFVTFSAIVGMGRLFETNDHIGPLALSAMAAHAVAALLRRRGVGLIASALILAGTAVVVTTWLHYGDTSAALLPTGATVDAVQDDLRDAWRTFQDVAAPAPVEDGFLVVSGLTIWFVAFVADWAAFRLWVPFEATLPAGTLFVFSSLLGADRNRVGSAALFAAATIGFLLIHRVVRTGRSAHWVADPEGRGPRSMLVAGVGLTSIAVVLSLLSGPALPGAEADAVIDYRDLDDDSRRVTVSPLVDIRTRLVDQADVEVFRVEAERRAYWRLTSLDEFDGRIWSSSGSYGKADGELPTGVDSSAPADDIEQTISMEALAVIWLPAAYEPRAIDPRGADLRYDEISGTLIVDQTYASSDGLTYEVLSRAPQLTADLLGSAGDDIPDDIEDRFLELPADFPSEVRRLASDITAGAASPYDRALLLQDHLRSAPFVYDLNVGNGHSTEALSDFLFETQRGYCEQFAGAFAAMARSVGLPARVAVGFTPGLNNGGDDTTYRVLGKHAHAWPEVYLDGFGWVAFEPTPNRGAPGAEGYTGIPEQQVDPNDPTIAVTTGGSGPIVDPVPTTTLPEGTATTAPSDPIGELDTGSGTQADEDDPFITARQVFQIVLGLAALALAYLLVVVGPRDLRRMRRRRRMQSPGQQVELAGIEVAEAAALIDLERRSSETHAEYRHRLRAAVPEHGLQIDDLFARVEVAAYALEEPTEDDAAHARDLAADVRRTIRKRAGWRVIVRDDLDWRNALGPQRRRRAAMATTPRALRPADV